MPFTQQELKKLIKYFPEEGKIQILDRDKIRIYRELSGKKNWYYRVWYNKKYIMLGKVLYLYMTGKKPSGEIIYADFDKMNIKWDNLVLASPSCVAFTGSLQHYPRINKTSTGITGVYRTVSNTFRSVIGCSNRSINLGTFKTLEEAVVARYKAEMEANLSDCFKIDTDAAKYIKKHKIKV